MGPMVLKIHPSSFYATDSALDLQRDKRKKHVVLRALGTRDCGGSAWSNQHIHGITSLP